MKTLLLLGKGKDTANCSSLFFHSCILLVYAIRAAILFSVFMFLIGGSTQHFRKNFSIPFK